MENDYPPSGTLFEAKTRLSDRSPDYTGQLELPPEVVDDLAKQIKDGARKPKLSIIGWKKVSSKSGKPFLSLRGNVFEQYNGTDNAEKNLQYKEKKIQEANETKSSSFDLDDEIKF
tara:strand:- start:152 stop:499 length:348 start_codon:yes stop_codon:yes gene_type:complete